MAKEPEFRLWSERRKTREHQKQTVIAKLKSPTGPLVPAELSMAAESARRGARRGVAGGAAASRLARIREYGYVVSVNPVFSEPAAARGALATLRDLAGGARARGVPRQAARSEGLVEIRVARGTDPKKLARHVAGMGDVEYAFVPPVRRPFGGRSAGGPDSLASRQWSHGAIRLGHARSASRFSDASDLVVAVVDSGIDESHPDLEGVIKEYRSFLKKEGKRDYIGHGTHVSGIISGSYRNGLGIGGVCGARILALKALPHDDDDWNATDYYNALRYVIGRADVLNLSLGGEKDKAEIDVLRDVIDSGVVVVAAMGNEYEEGNPVEYPAAMSEVCAVGATDHFDRRAGFSNTGKHIDLVAPGVQILSTTPTYEYDEPERTYALWDGTSMAAPHVAAAAALVLARHPGSTPAQVIQRLAASADRVAGAKKGSPSYGAGRLNCEDALA
jgi:subtilisin family serine protease